MKMKINRQIMEVCAARGYTPNITCQYDRAEAVLLSVGSDGTDGPTDAAGGYCDGDTNAALIENGLTADGVLRENDAYHALQKTGGLIFTGPTGTNVNDLAVILIIR